MKKSYFFALLTIKLILTILQSPGSRTKSEPEKFPLCSRRETTREIHEISRTASPSSSFSSSSNCAPCSVVRGRSKGKIEPLTRSSPSRLWPEQSTGRADSSKQVLRSPRKAQCPETLRSWVGIPSSSNVKRPAEYCKVSWWVNFQLYFFKS